MNKNVKRALVIVGLIIYSVVLVRFVAPQTVRLGIKTNDNHLARFIENYNQLKDNWYYFKDEKTVIDAATKAMVESDLKDDHYTMYIPPEDGEKYFASFDSEYVGIGVQYTRGSEYPIISKVFESSPAAAAKIIVGDNIVAVDGKNVKKLKTEQIQSLVKGENGTKAVITILRNNKEIKIDVVRKQIEASVHYRLIDNKGYLSIDDFTKTTPSEVKKALEFFKEKKISKVIIDVRDNPGGYLDSLEAVADLFMKKNLVVIKAKDNKGNITEYKTKNDDIYKNDYVLLTNGNSASASEAFVAAMNENLNIPIYGEKTFGKGIMQGFHEYTDGGYLKYTNAEWLTPKDHAINKKGIMPTKKINVSAVYNARNLEYSFAKAIKYDTVSKDLVSYQKALTALGYATERSDGYYSAKTRLAINNFKKKNGLEAERDLSKKVQDKIIERLFIETNIHENDNVLKEALK